MKTETLLFDLLPDAGHWRAVVAEVEAAFAAGGVGQAMGVLAAAFATVLTELFQEQPR
ncbi:hypothetical protein UO65_0650 [Actinokineospora spheciospongiae]|uniref:Uncharacterized protein n=1 Tax=Actinokineospora spheciospongiae TaxID=909613 RepID=W7JDD9_9PSEU|nr:hypothetical protein [Actinokineospora spheciospongiae]EWC64029.1 hypothetical protein UO65_0650 [Actinokineospora spheciospongiae]